MIAHNKHESNDQHFPPTTLSIHSSGTQIPNPVQTQLGTGIQAFSHTHSLQIPTVVQDPIDTTQDTQNRQTE